MAKKEVRVTQGAYAKVLGVGQPTVSKAIAAGKISSKAWDGKTINVAVADAEWGNAFRAVATDEVAIPTRDLNITNEMSLAEALRVERIIACKNALLDLEVKEGKYVSVALLAREGMVVGIEIRKELERSPNLMVDMIRGAKDRDDALRQADLFIHEMMIRILTALKLVDGQSFGTDNDAGK